MRILATASLSLAIALAGAALAQDGGLPDMGSSAAEMIDPATEAEYAEYLRYELRRLDLPRPLDRRRQAGQPERDPALAGRSFAVRGA